MDGHTQRGLVEQRALCERERGRIEAERRRAEPLVRARHTIAEYDVIQRIGRRSQTWLPLGQFYGCMGAAFQVKPHDTPGPLLVIKVVLNDPTHGGATRTDADVVEKFRSEIEFTGDPQRLPPHHNLPFTYHYFVGTARGLPDLDWMAEYTDRDTLCVVMEHIDGTSLQSLAGQLNPAGVDGASEVGGGALPLPEAMLLSYAEQLLRAIAHLKEHDIVHRDIKPDNVMVSGAFRQFLRLIDFGCAISVRESGFTFPLTPGGSKGGAIEYMSPEIQRARTGEQLDYSKNDEFSAGLTLWSLLTAQPPFGRDNLATVTDAEFIGVPPGYAECSNRLLCGLLRVDSVERLAASEGVDMIEAARVATEAMDVRVEEDLRAEQQRCQEIEVANAQLHNEIEQLCATAQHDRAQAERQHKDMARRLQVLEQELEATRHGGGATGVLHAPHEDVPPAISIAQPQQPTNAVFQVCGAGTAECNGYYKEDGKLRCLASHAATST